MKLDIINIEEEEDQTNSVLTNEANIVTFPLSVLDQKIIQAMQEMLYKLEGVGLAATQVNINKKIALIYIPENAALLREDIRTYPMHTIINPEYIGVEGAPKVSDFEGCYSVKNTCGKVLRYQTIQVKYQNVIGEIIEETVSGFYARVLQHEIDHLNGLLITDRLTPDCLQGTFEEMLEIRRQELPIDKRKQLDELIKDKKIISKDKK